MATAKVLVVGGGGGGGGVGAGGAGGYREIAAHAVSDGPYSVVVGDGGAAAANVSSRGSNGEDSVFDTITAAGGGGGGAASDTIAAGAAGGSGGGGGSDATSPYTGRAGGAGDTPSTSPAQGTAGGSGVTGWTAGGGGGGASAAGGNASGTTGGNGGAGTATSISGSSVTYAGGGGGSGQDVKGTGGAGGGGDGALYATSNATAGAANTGGGGGAGYNASWVSAAGGSGRVTIRYVTADFGTCTGGTITTDGADTIHTFTSDGTFTVVGPVAPRPVSHAWPNPAPAVRPSDRFGFLAPLNLPIYFYVPPPPFRLLDWPNPVRRVNAHAWQQSVTQGLSIPRDADYFYALVYVSVAGIARAQGRADLNARIDFDSLVITDTQADVPNTCTFVAHGFTPVEGQEVIVTLGSATLQNPERIFAGTILSIAPFYTGSPLNQSFEVNCIDWTWQLNRRKVIKRYTAQSASVIATDLIATYAAGFTSSHVQPGLESLDVITFTNQNLTSALTQLARRIGATWYIDYLKRLHFYVTESDANPLALTPAHPSLTDFRSRSDISQWITRAFSEGGGGNAASAVAVGETILPMDDVSWYEETGGVVACGPQRLAYAGRTLGGGGGLVGPGASPTAAPAVALASGAGVETGSHDYAVTFVTAAGESIPGPVGAIAVGTVAAPPQSPTPGSPTAGAGVTTGDHQYAVTFVNAAGETTASPLSGMVTTGPVTGTEVTAPGTAPTAGTPTVGSGVTDGSHDYVATFTNAAGETTVSPISGTAVAGQQATGSVAAPGSAPTVGTPAAGPAVNAGTHDYQVTYVNAVGETTPGTTSASASVGTQTPGAPTFQAGSGIGGSLVVGGSYQFKIAYALDTGSPPAACSLPSAAASATANAEGAVYMSWSPPSPADAAVVDIVVYRTVNGGSTFYYQGKMGFVNPSGNYYFQSSVSDATLVTQAAAPTTDTTTKQIGLTAIPTSGDGTVTSRKIYRRFNGAGTFKLLTTIANNSATTYTDTTANASLGADAPSSNTAIIYVAYNVVPLTGIPTSAQSITARKLYRRFNGSGTFKLVTTISGNSTTTYSDTKTNAQLGADAPSSNTTAGTTDYNVVPLTAIPLGAALVTSRKLYRTAAGGSQLKLLATIADNSTTTYNDSMADGSLGADVPVSNTAAANRVAVSSIQVGGASVTSRKLYRTVAGGSQLKLLATLADNTTATYADSTADASLGANVPTSDASGLTQPNGQVTAGSTSLIVAGTSAFAATGGWAVIGNGQQVIRYTGVTATALTGVPASGAGAIVASIGYNSTITAAPQLTGIPASGEGSILYAIVKGDPVNLLVQADDIAGQASLSALLDPLDLLGGAAGIQEDYRQDGRIAHAEAAARAAARLSLVSGVLVSVFYVVRDPLTKSGRPISVDLPAPQSMDDAFLIHKVTINNFSASPDLFPTYTVEASSSTVSFEQLLASLRQGTN